MIPCFLSTPVSSSLTPQLSAVCPPKLSAIASGFSFSITRSTNSGVTGTKYTPSARPQLVWFVAMFGLMRITFLPSSLNALIAWLPE